jgi:hypothetical protein
MRQLGVEQGWRPGGRQLHPPDPGGAALWRRRRDHTVEEQSAAIHALYDVARGEHQHLGVGRRARIGFQIDF